jgi:glycerol-3-phosphate O-acyltransferase
MMERSVDLGPRGPITGAMLVAVAPSSVESDLIEQWRSSHAPECAVLTLPHPKAGEDVDWTAAGEELVSDLDRELVPVRVLWLPEDRAGRRWARLVDVATDARHPGEGRQRRLAAREDRWRIVVGASAPVSAVRAHMVDHTGAEPASVEAFGRYTARIAVLALERAVNEVLGSEYKVPRLVREQILDSSRWRGLVEGLAGGLQRSSSEVAADAERYLVEMVAGRSRRVIDFSAAVYRTVYQQGYDTKIDYDQAQIERVREVASRHPIIVLPSHRSNLDAMVMPLALQENGLPRTHTLAGINMGFWPVGPVFRKAGAIFIRRDTADDPIYRAVLREYVGFLMEKRFGLQWYLEGGRSRTGKLLPPKMGLLSYVAAAHQEGRTDDVALIPASIAYDQLHEVSEYASEARGAVKQAEGIGWFVQYVRAQRQRFGKIYIRFAEPVLLSEFLGAPGGDANRSDDETGNDRRLQLQKLGLEVAWRINSVTPATPTALVTMALLATDGRALTAVEITDAVRWPVDHAIRRQIPMTASAAALDGVEPVRQVLDELHRHGVVHRHDGPSPLYQIGPDQHLAAAYYRNTVVHFFLVPAIVELALAAAAEEGAETSGAEVLEVIHREALHLRDLLKFDFFFKDRDGYLASVDEELDLIDPAWRQAVADGPNGAQRVLDQVPSAWSPAVLRPFLEAYWVVADGLARQSALDPFDAEDFMARMPNHGTYGLLRGWISSPEAVSTHLFKAGLDLAVHRQLTDSCHPETLERRARFVEELRVVLDRVDRIASSPHRRLDLDKLQKSVPPSMFTSAPVR